MKIKRKKGSAVWQGGIGLRKSACFGVVNGGDFCFDYCRFLMFGS